MNKLVQQLLILAAIIGINGALAPTGTTKAAPVHHSSKRHVVKHRHTPNRHNSKKHVAKKRHVAKHRATKHHRKVQRHVKRPSVKTIGAILVGMDNLKAYAHWSLFYIDYRSNWSSYTKHGYHVITTDGDSTGNWFFKVKGNTLYTETFTFGSKKHNPDQIVALGTFVKRKRSLAKYLHHYYTAKAYRKQIDHYTKMIKTCHKDSDIKQYGNY